MKQGEKLGWGSWALGLVSGFCFLLLSPFGLVLIVAAGLVGLFLAQLR